MPKEGMRETSWEEWLREWSEQPFNDTDDLALSLIEDNVQDEEAVKAARKYLEARRLFLLCIRKKGFVMG